jgi:hypothetical protein
MGIDLGMIDPDAPAPKVPSPTRPSDVHSHAATIVPPKGHVAVSVPMLHTVEHEEFNLPPMSSAFLAAIHAAEAPATAAAVKVI